MHRLANFDVSRQFLARRSKVAAQIVFGGMCAAAMIGVRSLIDVWAPVSGPFALIYPTVLLATLYGHWRAGVVALAVTFCWAWFFILPPARSFLFADPTDPVRVLLNAASAVVVVVFAEAFRRAAQATLSEIRERADRRLTLLAELEHRTKNNFALVASMLELQKRRIPQAELHAPLDDAVGRVRTFADAYSALALEQSDEPNEQRPGTIAVFFNERGGSWRFTIEDNGIGAEAATDPSGGLGGQLLAAFATQAQATHHAGPILNGYRTEMRREDQSELA